MPIGWVAWRSQAAVAGSTSGVEGIAHTAVIGVEPGDLVAVEQVGHDQVAVDRRQGQRFELQHLALGLTVRRLDQHQVFDADAIGAGFVIAGLVRDDHARQQGLDARRLGDALRPLVHAEIAADPVPGAVVVVEPLLPQPMAGKGVELGPGRPFRKAREGQRDMALQHPGKAVAHLVRGLADRDGAGHVGRAVQVLRARIEQVKRARLEPLFGLRQRPVMDDGAVRPGPRDRRKAQIAEMFALAAEGFEPVAGGDLGKPLFGRLAREPGQKPGQGGAVAAMRGARAIDLDRVFARLGQEARIGRLEDFRLRRCEPGVDP